LDGYLLQALHRNRCPQTTGIKQKMKLILLVFFVMLFGGQEKLFYCQTIFIHVESNAGILFFSFAFFGQTAKQFTGFYKYL
jgi:hypothetical protein